MYSNQLHSFCKQDLLDDKHLQENASDVKGFVGKWSLNYNVQTQKAKTESALFDAHAAVSTCLSTPVTEVSKYMQAIAEKVFVKLWYPDEHTWWQFASHGTAKMQSAALKG